VVDWQKNRSHLFQLSGVSLNLNQVIDFKVLRAKDNEIKFRIVSPSSTIGEQGKTTKYALLVKMQEEYPCYEEIQNSNLEIDYLTEKDNRLCIKLFYNIS